MNSKKMPKQPRYRMLEIVGEEQTASGDFYLLKDGSALVIKFPKNLVKANELKIENQHISLTQSLYDRWYENETAENIKKYDSLMFDHFEQLFDIREKIITNNRLYYVSPSSWLYSGGLFMGMYRYTLGALFNAWATTNDLLYANHLIIKIGGSGLSGANVYTAWDQVNKKIVQGSVDRNIVHWHQYVKVFQALSNEKKFSSQLNYLQSKELLETIGIKF